MDQWFNRVESYLKSINLLDSADISSRLWNADETGFCTSASSSLVLARKGSRTVHETCGGSGREFYTVLAAGAADGTRLPPFLLYKGAHLYARWTKNGPAGALYGVSGSGWMEGANFKNWFEKLFVPAVSSLLSTGAVVLFVELNNGANTSRSKPKYPSFLPATTYNVHTAATGCRCVRPCKENMEINP